MRLASSPWLRRVLIAAVIAFALGWLPYQFYGRSGVAQHFKLRQEMVGLKKQNQELRALNLRLRAELSLYDDDELAAVDRIARDELGLVKPGEIVFRLEDEK